MAQYIITYFGEAHFNSKEEGKEHMDKWRAWMGGIMDSVENPGVPMFKGKVVKKDSVSDSTSADRITGYTVVNANSIDEAVDLVEGCPHLDHGHIEVYEAMDMPMI